LDRQCCRCRHHDPLAGDGAGPNSWDANNGQSNTWSASLDTTHAHNVSIGNAAPPVTVSDFAGGASANMPPMLICTVALFAGA
jgi:hypothetical protein